MRALGFRLYGEEGLHSRRLFQLLNKNLITHGVCNLGPTFIGLCNGSRKIYTGA